MYRLPANTNKDKVPLSDVDGLNSAILPIRKQVELCQKKQSYASQFASHQKQLNTIQSCSELLEVVLFEVFDHGCKHAYAE